MSKDLVLRKYTLRNSGKSIKFAADGSSSGNTCKNCTLLSLELNKLRRQIALLTKQETISSGNTVASSEELIDADFAHVDDPGIAAAKAGNNKSSPLSIPVSTVNYLSAPYDRLYPGVASYLDPVKLDSDTKYTHNFSSRTVAYYGTYPYRYSGGFHEPTPFSENPYLAMVVENMKIHFPKLQFNSAMVTKYENGKQGIPPHSDNEECISSGSYICTVSLGETRTLEYRSISEASQISSRIQLVHGDILFMTRESQNLYQHSVPMDYTKNMRISITLRQITCPSTNSSTNPSINLTSFNCAETEFQDSRSQTIGFTTVNGVSTIRVDNQHLHNVLRPSKGSHTLPTIKKSVSTQACSSRDQQSINTDPRTNCDKNGTEGKVPRSTSLYISSSMFRKLDYKKLSSKSQDAHVFSYPGATAQIIKERFMNDEKKKSLDPSQVKNIMLMCGSNNIDSILRSPKEMRNQVLLHGKPKSHASLTDNTNLAIEDLVLFLHNWAPSATVKIINILPRQSRCRNEVISDINRFIIQLSNKYSYVKFVSTERERFLFTDRLGFRKSYFFSSQGEDNIHLNDRGLIRLAKHLKHHAHN